MKTALLAVLVVVDPAWVFAADPAKAVVPIAPIAAESKAASVLLFDGKTLGDWATVDSGGSGTVEVAEDEGAMLLSQGEGISGIIYKKAKDLPQQSYEISLETMRTQGVDFFCGLTFPVGGEKTCLTLVLGGWGGSVTGLSSIDGMDASENNTSSYQRFEDNKWYAVRLRVMPKEIKVWIDGKEIINTDIEGKKLGLRPGPIEAYAPLSLTTYNTAAAYRKIKITKLAN
jgi:hypothetical protein